MRKLLFLAAPVFILLSCTPFTGPIPGVDPPGLFVQHDVGGGLQEVSYSLNLVSAKSVYFAFDNPLEKRPQNPPTVSAPSNEKGILAQSSGTAAASTAPIRGSSLTSPSVASFNKDPFQGALASHRFTAKTAAIHPIPPAPVHDVVGQTSNGVTGTSGDWEIAIAPGPLESRLVSATCRSVSTAPVSIAGGDTRILNIWVEDDCWEAGGTKTYTVTPAMVTALEQKFLTGGLFNDIYDWVSAIGGSEWADYTSDPSVVPFDKNITILLCDIAGDDATDGGIVGQFYGKDNFKDEYSYYNFQIHSNERIMFLVDAVMYANPNDKGLAADDGSGWQETDYWAEETFSTLAHELQHMINFHQKGFVRNSEELCDIWINEMCSQAVEDLVSDKLGVMGPRGVDGIDPSVGPTNNQEGRLPLFNSAPYVSLSDWAASGSLRSYSVTYAFGAYLIRNYGGAALMRAMIQDSAWDQTQIVDAVSAYTGKAETFSGILQRWSAAVILSDRTDAPAGYVFNKSGWFDSAIGSDAYRVGSIDFFNYAYEVDSTLFSGPYMYSGEKVGEVPPRWTSGTLYNAGQSVNGKNEWLIKVPEGVTLTVVVK